MSKVKVCCPCCGYKFEIEVMGIRKMRLLEIFSYIEEKRPRIQEAILWIQRKYMVTEAKAREYLRSLAKIGYIKVSDNFKLVPVQTVLHPGG